MGLFSFLRGRKNVFTETVQRTAHVMTSSSNGTAFFGVLFRGQDEWMRVYTNELPLAEHIAFMLPDEVVRIETQGTFKEDQSVWHRLVRVTKV